MTSTEPFIAFDAEPQDTPAGIRKRAAIAVAGFCVVAVVAVIAISSSSSSSSASHSEQARFHLFGRSDSTDELPEGQYFRPPTAETSGFPGNDKPYKRSPCPALNTLANHGFLPRNGENLGIKQLGDALLEHYNLDWKIGAGLAVASRALLRKINPFSHLSLSDLSTHNAIEHDASLFHYDVATGRDPSEVSREFVEQLAALSPDGVSVGLNEIIQFRAARIAQDEASDPEYSLDSMHKRIGVAEAAFVIDVLGHDQSIRLDHLRSFAIDERIPEDWQKADQIMTLGRLQPTIDAIAEGLGEAAENVNWSLMGIDA